MVSEKNYFRILRLYIAKKKILNRKEFCDVLGINYDNTQEYKIIRDFILPALSFKSVDFTNIKIIYIDLEVLEDIIRSTSFYKINDNFIHKSTPFAVTG